MSAIETWFFYCLLETCYNQRMEIKDKRPPKRPEQIHKEQVLLQILVPVLLGSLICLLFLTLLLTATSNSGQSIQQWAQIATMFLIGPLLILGLIFLAITILFNKLSGDLNGALPVILMRIRLKILGFNMSIQNTADKPTKPLIFLKSIFAGIKAVFPKKI